MRKHAALGAEILSGSSSDVLQLAERIALTHHEWWNGNGYPAHLTGDEIPQCGRIVARGDVFDALTHERPYKEAWSIERAVTEIHRLRDVQFDPDVVEPSINSMRRSLLETTNR
jgi:putative two-component system response regulator